MSEFNTHKSRSCLLKYWAQIFFYLNSGKSLTIISLFRVLSRKLVLHEIDSMEDGIGVPDWRLTLGLLFSWVSIFFIIIKGVKSSGKASYFLALFPYVVMIALLVRGATLPGAVDGILFFITPQWDQLANVKVRIIMEMILISLVIAPLTIFAAQYLSSAWTQN